MRARKLSPAERKRQSSPVYADQTENPTPRQYEAMIRRIAHLNAALGTATNDEERRIAYAKRMSVLIAYKELFVHEAVEHAMGAARVERSGRCAAA